MYLKTIRIQGFKSLSDVELRDLSAINVFHGLNDVGKSNILQAIDLFFQLLPIGARALTGEEESNTGLSDKELLPYSESIFRQGGNGNIIWEAHLYIDDTHPDVTVRLVLNRDINLETKKVELRLTLFQDPLPDAAQRWFVELCQDPANDFTLVNAERRFAKEWMGEETAPIDYAPYYRHGSPVETERLKQVLFEAVRHPDLRQRERFKRLAKILDAQFGIGELDVTWDTPRVLEGRIGEPSRYGRDIIVRFLRPDMPEPLNLSDVGSGVQQLILLLGQMLFNPARSVGIEEPEMNLSPEWQSRLMAVFRDLVQAGPGGLDQIFITSHSSEFDCEPDYWHVTYAKDATRVTRAPVTKPLEEIGEELGPYLNSRQQVKVPQRVIDDLGLRHREPVFFYKAEDGRWYIRTKAEVLALMEPGEEYDASSDTDCTG